MGVGVEGEGESRWSAVRRVVKIHKGKMQGRSLGMLGVLPRRQDHRTKTLRQILVPWTHHQPLSVLWNMRSEEEWQGEVWESLGASEGKKVTRTCGFGFHVLVPEKKVIWEDVFCKRQNKDSTSKHVKEGRGVGRALGELLQ